MLNDKTKSIWAEVTAYASTNKTTRNLLKRSYERLFEELLAILESDYPAAPSELKRTMAYSIGCLLDRVGTLRWMGVDWEPLDTTRKAIAVSLEELARASDGL